MAYKVKKNCRVCGKLYTPCSVCEDDKSAFHWRTVACSEECGKEYLKRVMKARTNNASESDIKIQNEFVDNETDTAIKNTDTKKNYYKKRTTKNIVKDNEKSEQID